MKHSERVKRLFQNLEAQCLTSNSDRSTRDLACDKKTPPQILWQLARSGDSSIKQLVVDNPNSDVKTLLALAIDPDPAVRFALAQNHHLPRQILKILSEDDNPYVACRAQKTAENLTLSAVAPRLNKSRAVMLCQ